MKDIKKLKIKRIVIIIGILIIPLMYSYFYLKAFWDPYSKLEKLPVAVINKDEGATINSNERNIGKEIQKEMTESNELGFKFVTSDEAEKGLKNGEYYATIVIPEDFSKDIATASESKKTSATLIYSPNEKTNYLATQILNRAILELSDKVKTNVVGEVVTQLSDNLNQMPSKLSEINDGVIQLYDGATQLKDGTQTLKSGTNTLNLNYTTFNLAVNSLNDGVIKINKGTKDLDSGLSEALTGANILRTSTKDLYKIDDSVKALNNGTSNLNTSATTYVTGVNEYIAQSNEIGQKIAAYVASNPCSMLDTNIQDIVEILTNPNTTIQVNALVSGGNDLKNGTKLLNG
jgi:putative membrane protein